MRATSVISFVSGVYLAIIVIGAGPDEKTQKQDAGNVTQAVTENSEASYTEQKDHTYADQSTNPALYQVRNTRDSLHVKGY
jgi:hypothetical protein